MARSVLQGRLLSTEPSAQWTGLPTSGSRLCTILSTIERFWRGRWMKRQHAGSRGYLLPFKTITVFLESRRSLFPNLSKFTQVQYSRTWAIQYLSSDNRYPSYLIVFLSHVPFNTDSLHRDTTYLLCVIVSLGSGFHTARVWWTGRCLRCRVPSWLPALPSSTV